MNSDEFFSKIVWPVCKYCGGNAIGLLDKQPDKVCTDCFKQNPYQTVNDVLKGIANVDVYDAPEVEKLKHSARKLLK